MLAGEAKHPRDVARVLVPDGYATSFDVFGHRLGLSATPLSDFDDNRNRFILSSFADPHQDYTAREDWNESTLEEQRQIRISSLVESNAVFFFGLEAAIKRGVLVEFDYTAWEYTPTAEEYEERQNVRRYWKKKISDGEAPPGTTPSWPRKYSRNRPVNSSCSEKNWKACPKMNGRNCSPLSYFCS